MSWACPSRMMWRSVPKSLGRRAVGWTVMWARAHWWAFSFPVHRLQWFVPRDVLVMVFCSGPSESKGLYPVQATHLPALQVLDQDRKHAHLQHLPLKPEPRQTPDWVREDAPYSSHDSGYHYHIPFQHIALLFGDADGRAHIQVLQETLKVLHYHSALRPASSPAHLQKRRIQLLAEQLRFLSRLAWWPARKHIHILDEHIRCPCDHVTPEDCGDFKTCPLHAGRDTQLCWSPAETLQQHEGWPMHRHAHEATNHLFSDPLIKQATMRGAVTQALQRHLTQLTEDPMKAAAHLQLEAVRWAAAQLPHRKRLLLAHTEQLTDPSATEHMLGLIQYHAVHDPDVH